MNSKRYSLLAIFMLAAFLLAACAGGSLPTAASESTQTPAGPVDCPIVPGPTPCAPADATSSPPGPAASTQVSTTVPEPGVVMPVGNPSPTPDLAGLEVNTATFTSSDEAYQVQITNALPTQQRQIDQYYTRVDLKAADSQQPRVIEESWQPYGMGFTTPTVVLWPETSLYVYLADYAIPDGCSAFRYYENLRRVSVSDATVEPLAADVQGQLAVSPDETRVATLRQTDVVVHTLETGAEQTAAFTPPPGEFWAAGNPHWSPASDQLVFEVVEDICAGAPESRRGIYLLDLASMQVSPLVELSQNKYHIDSWLPDGKIRLNEGTAQHTWLLDPASGEITPEG